MSVSARKELPGVGSSAVPARTGTDARDTAGLLLARLTVLPALLVLPFLLTSFPLLLLGWFKPAPVIVLWLLLAAVIVPMGWRRVPSVTGAADTGTASVVRQARTPTWVLVTLAAVTIAFGIQQTLYHSQYIIVQTDPASYMQFAAWISQHGSLPIPQHAAAFGGAPGLSFASPAFYQVGGAVVPQFMAGLPMALSLGFWAGGARTAVFMGPLFGAAAVFMFGGLTARLVGPRWAPVAALTLAVTLPQQYTGRSTFSEPLAQILLVGGLALWIDSQRTDRGPADAGPWRTNWRSATHVLAALTGLMLGIALLVRIDAPADILLIVPFCGLLVIQRRRQVVPLVLGMLVGLVYGTVDGLVLSRPYLHTNASSVKPMVMVFVALAVLTALAVMLLLMRGRELPRLHPRLIDAAAIVPFVVLAAFVIRPYVQRNWSKLQYAPLSLHWVYWYIGGPVIVLATIATSMLVPARGGAGLGAAAAGVRVVDRRVPVPAGDHPAPAVGQPSAGPRRAARPYPARGVAGRLAHPEGSRPPLRGPAAVPRAGAADRRGRLLCCCPTRPGHDNVVRPWRPDWRLAGGPADRERAGDQADLRRRDRRGQQGVRRHPARLFGAYRG
jgi:hypothetical protein